MQLIDLSHVINPSTPVYPGTEKPVFVPIDIEGYAELKITMYTHTATHMDAPYHIIKGTKTLDDFPVSKFIGKGMVIDCRKFSGGRITLDFLKTFESKIRDVAFLLLRTGWSDKWGDDSYFDNFPALTNEAAQWLTNFNLEGIGLDCISLDTIADEHLPNHHIVLKKEILIIENLACLDKLPDDNFIFQCLPLKIEKADGSPVRAVAITD